MKKPLLMMRTRGISGVRFVKHYRSNKLSRSVGTTVALKSTRNNGFSIGFDEGFK